MLSQRRSNSLKWQTGLICVSLFCLYFYYKDTGSQSGHISRHLLQAAKEETSSEQSSNGTCGIQKSDDSLFPKNTFSDDELSQGAIILYIIGVLYMFYALALVCDQYFVPSLEVIIEKFGISQDVAGATLMAAGGSAPELFTSVIGVFIAVSDVGTGTIVGSAVFNVLFVIAACAFASADALSLTAWPLIRDTFFYSVSLALLVGFFTDKQVTWWEALILFLWYIVYVVFMKFNVIAEGKFHEIFPSLKRSDDGDNPVVPIKFLPHRTPLFDWMKVQINLTKSDDVRDKNEASGIHALKKTLEKGQDKSENAGLTEKPEDEEDVDAEKDLAVQEQDYKDMVMSGPQGSLFNKIVWCLTLPLMVPMWLSTPDPNNPSRKKYYALTFGISIMWIMVFSYLMVWWTTVIGNWASIPDAVMGLTFLAAGTSVPDLITSVLVAKQGHGDMAVSSSIGSNIFDVCVGLPVPWFLWTVANGQAKVIDTNGMGCNVGMLFLMLILVFASIMVFKWKMTKLMGGLMLVLYAIFVTVSLLFSFCAFTCPFDSMS